MAKQAERVSSSSGTKTQMRCVLCRREQEYFLIDRSFFLSRPDLLNSGRTLSGQASEGSRFDDLLRCDPDRVLAYMMDCERNSSSSASRQDPAQRSRTGSVRTRTHV